MVNKRYINHRMTLSVQGFLLKYKYPESYVAVKNNRLIWFGKIKPTPLSRVYNVRLVCKKGNKPRVFLYGKHIIGIERDDFPHRYNKNLEKQEVELCLNMPIEFNYSLRIIDTIILWIQEWLYYYEIWLATNEWRGGGHTPS